MLYHLSLIYNLALSDINIITNPTTTTQIKQTHKACISLHRTTHSLLYLFYMESLEGVYLKASLLEHILYRLKICTIMMYVYLFHVFHNMWLKHVNLPHFPSLYHWNIGLFSIQIGTMHFWNVGNESGFHVNVYSLHIYIIYMDTSIYINPIWILTLHEMAWIMWSFSFN